MGEVFAGGYPIFAVFKLGVKALAVLEKTCADIEAKLEALSIAVGTSAGMNAGEIYYFGQQDDEVGYVVAAEWQDGIPDDKWEELLGDFAAKIGDINFAEGDSAQDIQCVLASLGYFG